MVTWYRGFRIIQVSNGFVAQGDTGVEVGGRRGELPTEAHAKEAVDRYLQSRGVY